MKFTHQQTVLAITALFLAMVDAEAQVFAVLHSLQGSDGAEPYAGLVLSGNTLYGTTYIGGTFGQGTVFKVNTDGTGFSDLHTFDMLYATNAIGSYTNEDGVNPEADLLLSGDTLYGTTSAGGPGGSGTVFKMSTDGTGFTSVHNFSAAGINNDGAFPTAGLVLLGDTLYGTAGYGGSFGNGNVFAVNTNGSGFRTLHEFGPAVFGPNVDGAVPEGNLISSGKTFYGTTAYSDGGFSENGTVFKLNMDGTGFTNLHVFSSQIAANSSGNYTNTDGANPSAGLVLSGNTLYGTAAVGSKYGLGTLFAVSTEGRGFTNIHDFAPVVFSDTNNPGGNLLTNSVGAAPLAGLLLTANTLYGTTAGWNSDPAASGAVFKLNIDGTGFTNLHTFTALHVSRIIGDAFDREIYYTNSDGAAPSASLVLLGNTIYGTASRGGSGENGTVFALSFGPIPLNAQFNANTLVLRWGNPGFSLQAAPTISGVYSNVPGAASPYIALLGNSQQFFRLHAN